MNNNPTLWFSYKTKTLSSKNKLEKDILVAVDELLNRRLYTKDELASAFLDFQQKVFDLQAKHTRCKPLTIHYNMPDKHRTDACVYESDLFTVHFYLVRNIKDEQQLTEALRKQAL